MGVGGDGEKDKNSSIGIMLPLKCLKLLAELPALQAAHPQPGGEGFPVHLKKDRVTKGILAAQVR